MIPRDGSQVWHPQWEHPLLLKPTLPPGSPMKCGQGDVDVILTVAFRTGGLWGWRQNLRETIQLISTNINYIAQTWWRTPGSGNIFLQTQWWFEFQCFSTTGLLKGYDVYLVDPSQDLRLTSEHGCGWPDTSGRVQVPTEKPTSPTSPMDEHPLTEVGSPFWAKSGAEKGRNLFGTVTDDCK